MNEIIGMILGAIAAKLVVILFFTKVFYPIFLKKHEGLILELIFGEEDI